MRLALIIMLLFPLDLNSGKLDMTAELCQSLAGVWVKGECLSQIAAFRSIERWPNFGGHSRRMNNLKGEVDEQLFLLP